MVSPAKYLVTSAILAMLSAQFFKVLFHRLRQGAWKWELFTETGGMPSSHSALVCTLAFEMGLFYGFTSPICAVSIILALIVIYDSIGVRRQAGEQALILHELLEHTRGAEGTSDWKLAATLRHWKRKGHTPIEVLGGLILGLFYAVITYWIWRDYMNSFDLVVYHFVNGLALHAPIIDWVMAFIAQYALEIYAVLFVIAWFTLPKSDVKVRHSLVVSVCAGVAALLINVIISHIWFRPRPFVTLPKGSFNQLIPHSADASFPSDHTSGSYAFAAATWGRSSLWIRRSFTTLAVLVMFARVYTGVHWPTDVIASLVVGVIAGKLMWKLSPWILPLTKFGLKLFRIQTTDQIKMFNHKMMDSQR